jgi:hypothetical protein
MTNFMCVPYCSLGSLGQISGREISNSKGAVVYNFLAVAYLASLAVIAFCIFPGNIPQPHPNLSR